MAHNHKVVGSNPTPATKNSLQIEIGFVVSLYFCAASVIPVTTYRSGIAQASAHRVINRIVSDYLLVGMNSRTTFAFSIKLSHHAISDYLKITQE